MTADGIPESLADLEEIAGMVRKESAGETEVDIMVATGRKLRGMVAGLSMGECNVAYRSAAEAAGVTPVSADQVEDEYQAAVRRRRIEQWRQ